MNQEEWLSVRRIGSQGWDVFDNPQDIKDQSVSDVLNMVFDRGLPTPRGGSQLLWEKPEGETEDLLCLFDAKNSRGINYAIAVYAPNFYLRDEINDQWVKISDTYTPNPVYKELMYGYINWNAGISHDALYACNGTEVFIKWPMYVGYLSVAADSADTTLTLSDATSFPSSTFQIVVQAPGSAPVYSQVTSKSGNILTLSAPIGVDIDSGAVAAAQISNVSAIEKGKVMAKFKGRLVTSNQDGAENSLFASQVGNPEIFTPGSDADDPFALVITDGNGEITGLDDFGEYLLIEKSDSQVKLDITTALDTDGASYQTVNTTPIIGGQSMGPLQPWGKIKKNNFLYYITETEGIFSVDPSITGGQTSTESLVISQQIQPFILSLDFSDSRVATFDQKMLWTATSAITGDVIVVWDLLRKIWTRFNNWPVKDWLNHNKQLLYGSRIDGNIYKTFTLPKIDHESSFDAYFISKYYDMGQPSIPKTMGKLFVSGYITETEELFFDVLFNIKGSLRTVTYKLNGSGKLVFKSKLQALGMMMMGVFVAGSTEYTTDGEGMGYFTIYLAIPSRYGFYAIGIKPYSSVDGTDWGITGIGFSPWVNLKHDATLELGAIGDPYNDTIQS